VRGEGVGASSGKVLLPASPSGRVWRMCGLWESVKRRGVTSRDGRRVFRKARSLWPTVLPLKRVFRIPGILPLLSVRDHCVEWCLRAGAIAPSVRIALRDLWSTGVAAPRSGGIGQPALLPSGHRRDDAHPGARVRADCPPEEGGPRCRPGAGDRAGPDDRPLTGAAPQASEAPPALAQEAALRWSCATT
jgi:hypothetical protein